MLKISAFLIGLAILTVNAQAYDLAGVVSIQRTNLMQ